MANRVLIVVLAAVVLASMVVGGLLGMQFAGGGGEAPGTATTTPATPAPTDTPTATPTATAAEATPTPTDTSTASVPTRTAATPVQSATPTFSPASVNTTAVERQLRALVDEEFRRGSGPLAYEATLDEMAQFHSENMREQGYVSHAAGGYSTEQRYRMDRFDRYDRCRVPSDNNAGIRDGEELEVVGRVPIDTTGDWSERAVAERLVAEWTDDDTATERLGLVNADQAGVGVAVSEEGRVYVTVDLC